MPNQIIQQPGCYIQPASTPTVFTIENQNIVLNETDVKFICEIHIGRTTGVLTSLPIATLKASPNAAGVGMFDVSPVIEAYVNCSFEGRRGITSVNSESSTFKTVGFSEQQPHAIHQIDKFCTNKNNLTWYFCRFRVEYRNTTTDLVEIDDNQDRDGTIKVAWNGVLRNTDPITYTQPPYHNYFYDPQDVQYENGGGDYFIRGTAGSKDGGRFISNMPEQQFIGENDYGTVAFFNCINNGQFQTNPADPNKAITNITLRFYDASNATTQTNTYDNIPANGGRKSITSDQDVSVNWVYFGHGLANMKGRGETWPSNSTGYEVFVNGEGGEKRPISRIYRFDILPESCRGYKPVRLAWQNVLGAWDYFTFNMKSKTTVKSKRKNYQQLAGTWNARTWRPKDHLGGQKVFNNSAIESLQLYTDYVSEATAAWLQELFTSSQVYIVNSFSDTNPVPGFFRARYIHKYIEPVVVKSSSYTKKTRANDGLIKYDIKIEKSKPLNIQRA